MPLKSLVKIASSLLFLYAVVGFLFPDWPKARFEENLNVIHLIAAAALNVAGEIGPKSRLRAVFVLAVFYLALGLYGFSQNPPGDFSFKSFSLELALDPFDNYAHTGIGLALAYVWLTRRDR